MDEEIGLNVDNGEYFDVKSPFSVNHQASPPRFASNESDKHLPPILESEEYVSDAVQQQEEFNNLQSRFRRQTTENFISSLSAIAPDEVKSSVTNAHDPSQLIEIGTLYSDMTNKKMKMNVRKLLLEVNSVGVKYDEKYQKEHPHEHNHKSPSKLSRQSPVHFIKTNKHEVIDHGNGDSVPPLKLRDLRRLENHFNHHEEPYVLIRRHCVLLSLGPHIRAIVQAERLMILVYHEEQSNRILDLLEEVVKKLMKTHSSSLFRHSTDMLSELASGTAESDMVIPFEVRAYAVLFSIQQTILQKDLNEFAYHSSNMIAAIADHTILSVRLQEFMHANKDNVGDLLARVNGCRRLISGLLEEEDDLLYLNLKVLQNDPSLYSLPADEAARILYSRYSDIEPLIESVLIDYRTLENQTEMLLKKLNNTEQSVNLRLDTSRNELLYATTILSVFASTIAFSGYITGAFGMNLDNVDFIQPVKGTFWGVFIASFSIFIILALAILYTFQSYKILPSHAHLIPVVYTRKGSIDMGNVQQQQNTQSTVPFRRVSLDYGVKTA